MTVYKLIQKLAEFEADLEVTVSFTVNAEKVECPECFEEIEIVKKDLEDLEIQDAFLERPMRAHPTVTITVKS